MVDCTPTALRLRSVLRLANGKLQASSVIDDAGADRIRVRSLRDGRVDRQPCEPPAPRRGRRRRAQAGHVRMGHLQLPTAHERNHIGAAHTEADSDRTLGVARTLLRSLVLRGRGRVSIVVLEDGATPIGIQHAPAASPGQPASRLVSRHTDCGGNLHPVNGDRGSASASAPNADWMG